MNMKQILLTATILASALSFGAANDTVLVFSTKGPDTYGDGSTVLDGERYALVWVKDGTEFAGLTADCKSCSETTKLIAVAPLAKGGHCPETVFEIDADYAETLKGGSFALYLLDTRVEAGKLAGECGGRGATRPTSVNAAGVAVDGTSALNSSLSTLNSASAVALAAVGVYTKLEEPKIAGIRPVDGKVEIRVSGMSGAANYYVVQGATPGQVETVLPSQPSGDTFTVDAPKGGAAFFKVIGVGKFR